MGGIVESAASRPLSDCLVMACRPMGMEGRRLLKQIFKFKAIHTGNYVHHTLFDSFILYIYTCAFFFYFNIDI